MTYLPSNWILLDKETSEVKSASKYIDNKDARSYGFDSFRIMWRVGLDATWFNEPKALEYLHKVSPFFEKEWQENGRFTAIYNLEGQPAVDFSSLSTSTGALSIFTVTNKDLADKVYNEIFEREFNYDTGYWRDKNNYYDQNWVWFGTALYTNNLPNFWGTN